jgi:excisionase family DNA binding protein
MKDGDTVEFGDVRLGIMETPGHTPEGISILVYDLAKSDEDPLAVLTGDTLFIGDVGRPDLLASIGVTADELADMLYDSITNKLVTLPDAARFLSVSRGSLYDLLTTGQVASVHIGRSRRIPMGELHRYIRERLERERCK